MNLSNNHGSGGPQGDYVKIKYEDGVKSAVGFLVHHQEKNKRGGGSVRSETDLFPQDGIKPRAESRL